MKSRLKSFADILGITLPDPLRGLTYNRVLTQSEYVTSEDVVISAGWYSHHRVVAESLEKNALLIVCDRATKADYPQENVIGVDDPLECVQRFERAMMKHFCGKLIAITGSVGKTTTTGLINTVIKDSALPLVFTCESMSNSHGAILRHTQRISPLHRWWVQEVGGVQPDYIESSACILQPDIVVLTNIGESHLNTYLTRENILHDKTSLERHAKPNGYVIINKDDEMLRNATYTHPVITVSLQDPTADYYAKDIQTTMDGLWFTAVCSAGEFPVQLNLYGNYNAYNALSALAVGMLAKIPVKKILASLSRYTPSGMRQNMLRIGGYTMMVDVFNAEPKTVLGAAQTLAQIERPQGGRRLFITGHIDKLGEHSAAMHEALGHELAKLDLDGFVLYGGDSKYIYKAMTEDGKNNVILTHSREELENWMRKNIRREDLVFYKSGQFETALAKSLDHVYGTAFRNEEQYNQGTLVEKDGFVFRLRRENIAEVEKYTGSDTDVVIPDTVEGHTVLRIRDAAFRKNYDLRSLTIPDSVVNIGAEACYICPKLKTLVLPKHLRIIGKNAFNDCKALEEVVIPDGTIHIDRHAFYDNTSLRNITIPESVGFLGEDCFGHSKSLTVHAPKGSYAASYAAENGLQCD